MTVNTAKSLLAIEREFVDLDGRLKDLARWLELTACDGSDLARQRVRKARAGLQKALWDFSGHITDAIEVLESNPEDLIPF